MLILGDFATPREKIKFINYPVSDQIILLNCEGYLVESIIENRDKNSVFNNVRVFCNLNSDVILNLANNHVLDTPCGIQNSIELSKKYSLKTIGGYLSAPNTENMVFTTVENRNNITIISAGWDVIGCKHFSSEKQGVVPLKESLLIQLICENIKEGNQILVYLHWGYEMEIYPLPTHRKLARKLIDVGADLIVGCHSHCIQGYEKYKGKYIFYGLGNTVFEENYYHGGKLKFPEICRKGLAVFWNPGSLLSEINIYETYYQNSELLFSKIIDGETGTHLKNLSRFAGISDKEYVSFFKENRRKKKALPILSEADDTFLFDIKSKYVKVRAFVISFLFKIGIKKSSN